MDELHHNYINYIISGRCLKLNCLFSVCVDSLDGSGIFLCLWEPRRIPAPGFQQPDLRQSRAWSFQLSWALSDMAGLPEVAARWKLWQEWVVCLGVQPPPPCSGLSFFLFPVSGLLCFFKACSLLLCEIRFCSFVVFRVSSLFKWHFSCLSRCCFLCFPVIFIFKTCRFFFFFYIQLLFCFFSAT